MDSLTEMGKLGGRGTYYALLLPPTESGASTSNDGLILEWENLEIVLQTASAYNGVIPVSIPPRRPENIPSDSRVR